MKKVVVIFLSAILVMLPTIAAAVLYLMPDDIIQTPININGTFFGENGSKYEFNRNKNSFLASFFDALDENSTPSELNVNSISYDHVFYADITKKDKTERITLYCSANNRCYYYTEKGALYLINNDYSSSLLSSEFAISLYEKLYTPSLITYSNDKVIPSSSAFKYTVKGGAALEGRNDDVTNKIITYYSSNPGSFSFSVKPTTCNIKAYIGDTLYYDGELYRFNENNIPKNSTVRYEVDALWSKTSGNYCLGKAHYSFYISYAPAPVFSVDNTSIEAGEFIVVKATNILDTSKIQCSSSSALEIAPHFFKNGDNYYALIPFGETLASGNYQLTLSCAETSKTITVTVEERTVRTQPAEEGTYDKLTSSAIQSMNELVANIGSQYSDKIYPQSTFFNYEDMFSIRLGFGHIRQFSEDLSLALNGVDFYAEADISIPAMNDGTVCASGEDAILGKYIVIDHGYGLKSWYCNIGQTSVAIGTEVQKGDTVAKTGSSNFYGQPGFYLITTVLGKPVSPYSIYENNFVLPQ